MRIKPIVGRGVQRLTFIFWLAVGIAVVGISLGLVGRVFYELMRFGWRAL